MKLYKNIIRYERMFITTEPIVLDADQVDGLRQNIEMYARMPNAATQPGKIEVEVSELEVIV